MNIQMSARVGPLRFTLRGPEPLLAVTFSEVVEVLKNKPVRRVNALRKEEQASITDTAATSEQITSEASFGESSVPDSLAHWLADRGTKILDEDFVATAVWLSRRGDRRLTRGEVRDALIANDLIDSETTMMTNVSLVFNSVERKGWVQREPGGRFVVTELGFSAVDSRFERESK